MRLLSALLVLIGLVCAQRSLHAAETGDPAKPARLEFIYATPGFMARLDGQNLQPNQETRCVTEVGAGKHLLEVYKQTGLFKAEKVADTTVELPGAMITRLTFREGKVVVLDTVPVPGAATPQAAPAAAPAQTTTTVTTRTVRGQAPAETVTMNVGVPGMGGVALEVGGMTSTGYVEEETTTTTTREAEEAPAVEAAPRPSKLSFMSEQGMCTIYLDGSKRLELPLSGIDEMAKGSIFDLMPGNYLIKVEGFEVWYEGVLKVGSGEELKIRVEPQQFKVIARNPL
jgi:hypothetical protein